jgi:hypothetical protein
LFGEDLESGFDEACDEVGAASLKELFDERIYEVGRQPFCNVSVGAVFYDYR